MSPRLIMGTSIIQHKKYKIIYQTIAFLILAIYAIRRSV